MIAEDNHKMLKVMDEMPFGRFHLRAIVVSGVGFFTDAYDLFIIGLVAPMLGWVYFQQNGNAVPSSMDGAVKGAAAVGTLVGQLLFGWLADRLGRKKMYGVELIIMIVGTLASACAVQSDSLSILWFLVITRFVVGVGIGGDYPLSAVITSEFASVKHRGRMLASVFAMQVTFSIES